MGTGPTELYIVYQDSTYCTIHEYSINLIVQYQESKSRALSLDLPVCSLRNNEQLERRTLKRYRGTTGTLMTANNQKYHNAFCTKGIADLTLLQNQRKKLCKVLVLLLLR